MYKKLGDYIRQVDMRNKDLNVSNLLGVSVKKIFMPSIANTVGTNFAKYKIVKKNQFTYIPDTSRRGDKIGIAMLENYDEALVSQAYTVFEILNSDKLNPEYLMMWFRRPEFDRYARYKSHGSVREIFDWDEMCDIELPVPDIEKQREIVREYNVIVDRIKLNEKMCEKLEETAQAVYRDWFVEFEFPVSIVAPQPPEGGGEKNSPPREGWQAKPDGVVKRATKNYMSLPYNPKLKDRAKELRKAGNLSEVLFWNQVKNKQFQGLDFDRQKIIGNYIVDFYCASHGLVIEIDGSSHDNKEEYDRERDAFLKGLDLTVIHIDDYEVKKNLEGVMTWLSKHPVFRGDLELNHPVFQAPLQRRGMGYKSSGGEMVWCEELGKDVPKGWEVKELEKIIEIFDSQRIPLSGDERQNMKKKYPYYGAATLMDYVEDYIFDGNYILLGEDGTVVTEKGNPILQYVYGKFWVNNHAHVLKGRNGFNEDSLFLLLKNTNITDIITGGVQAKISQGNLKAIKIFYPSNKEILKNFNSVISPFFEKIKNLQKQTQNLQKLKSLLLSRMAK